MDVFDKFFQKYSYKFPKGYPDMNDPNDVLLLENIIEKLGVNLNETITNSEDFEKFILNKYSVPGQSISGLPELFDAIEKSPKKNELLNIIQNSGNKSLSPGNINIKDIDSILFNLIMSYVDIKNGNPSELWFAIMFDGKVKGGVASEIGIESDVDVDGKGVSIKNYTTINDLDFGSLSSEDLKYYKKIINLLSILTDTEITASLTIKSLNQLLSDLNKSEVQEDLKQILNIGKDTQIKSLKNIYNTIISLLPNGNVEELVNNFINKTNEIVEKKIKSVDWWAVIEGKTNMYLEPSSVIADKVKSTGNQLSPIIKTIKGNNLFINGNLLFKKTKE
jgi:hypothetical protein